MLIQGDTTSISIKLSENLEKNQDIKIGFYRNDTTPVYEAYLSDNTVLQRVDKHNDKNFICVLTPDISMKLLGNLEFRAVIFDKKMPFVNSSENHLDVNFKRAIANRKLK